LYTTPPFAQIKQNKKYKKDNYTKTIELHIFITSNYNDISLPYQTLLWPNLTTHPPRRYLFRTIALGIPVQLPTSYSLVHKPATSNNALILPQPTKTPSNDGQSIQCGQLPRAQDLPLRLTETDSLAQTNPPHTKVPYNVNEALQIPLSQPIHPPKHTPSPPEALAKTAQYAPSLIPRNHSSFNYYINTPKGVKDWQQVIKKESQKIGGKWGVVYMYY
jgi:hypothetical protein